jgi:hypothetical protein
MQVFPNIDAAMLRRVDFEDSLHAMQAQSLDNQNPGR